MKAEVIADRLRGQAETWRGYLPDDTLWDMSDHQFTESVLMAFGLDDMDVHVHEAFDKLAVMFDAFAMEAKVDTDALREVAEELAADYDESTSIAYVNLFDSNLSDQILEAIGDADKQ